MTPPLSTAPHLPTVSLPPRVRLMGMPVDCVTQQEAIAYVLDRLEEGRGGWVITPNLDQLRQYHCWPELRPMYERAQLVLADGMPLLWAARLQRMRLPERVAGSELIYTLTAAAAKAGRSIFLLGGNLGAAEGAAVKLQELNPELGAAGTHFPPLGFEKDPDQIARMIEALQAAKPDIVFVGLGFPKQEKLIDLLRDRFPQTWFLGVGISFSFVAGQIKRAPKWVQAICCEWLHRMLQEPRRLFVRYIVNDLPFAVRLFATSIWQRLKMR
jgi:N-acetylglucosaminyldiphosphoundecaprenol N-acetyl-beta-D-mannosaminyltransferase